MRPRWTVAALAWLAGCGGGKEVCPLPQGAASPVWADANADGVVDVNDGTRIARASLAGGPEVACRGQGDLEGTGDRAVEAAFHIWNYLFLGDATGMPELDGCQAVRSRVASEPTCARLEIAVEGPDRVRAPAGVTTFDATVRLTADEIQPDAWSFGVAAEGCTIGAAIRDGTVADSAFTGGVVDVGFAHAAVVDGGAVSAVVPSWKTPIAVDASGEGVTVLSLSVRAEPPADGGCGRCTLTPTAGLQGTGQPVALVVGAGGWSYTPDARAFEVQVCPE